MAKKKRKTSIDDFKHLDIVELSPKDVQYLLGWRDKNKDLVRGLQNFALKEGIVYAKNSGEDNKNAILYFKIIDIFNISIKIYMENNISGCLLKFIWNSELWDVNNLYFHDSCSEADVLENDIPSAVTLIVTTLAYMAYCEKEVIVDTALKQPRSEKKKHQTTGAKRISGKKYLISQLTEKREAEYRRHCDMWKRRGYFRTYRNEDGTVKKKVWVSETICKARESSGDSLVSKSIYKI